MSAKRIAREILDVKKDALPEGELSLNSYRLPELILASSGCTAGPKSDKSVYEWSAQIGEYHSSSCRAVSLRCSSHHAEGPVRRPTVLFSALPRLANLFACLAA